MVTRREIEQWLEEGIIAAKAGQREQARFRLLDVVEQDQTNETAWFWLYQVFDRQDDRRICLENLIIINPGNEWAKQELLKYLEPSEIANLRPQSNFTNDVTFNHDSFTEMAEAGSVIEEAPPASDTRPITLKLVIVFWIGISIIFLGGGIIASGEWLVSGLRTRTFPDHITLTQVFELLAAITFVIVGVVGINVAIGLFLRSMAGFYGSLLLALGLLLAGPTISLIADPPNYLALVCTGGISGMIVLLTLASQPGLKDTDQENGDTFD